MPTCLLPIVVLVMTLPTAGGTHTGVAASPSVPIASAPDSAGRSRIADSLEHALKNARSPLTGDSEVTLIYRGNARRVFVAGDLNGWDPGTEEMTRIPGTDTFYRSWTLDPAARFEYKLVVDSVWMTDPLNPLKASGGFGENSEVRMPRYRFPVEALPGNVPHGTFDTVSFEPGEPGRRAPVYVYLPPGYAAGTAGYGVLYVMDGGEYLSLTGMNVILDNLIAAGEITPIIAVFIDPRTDPADPRTNMRMKDYALNDVFVDGLIGRLIPLIGQRYRTLRDPAHRAIMGASMGGLIATYAAFMHPDVFGLCGAESPSYQWKSDTLITLLRDSPRRDFRMYLCTGTIRDAEKRARIMRDVMRARGYDVTYRESPESHNWMNWRGRLGDLLRTFWGRR